MLYLVLFLILLIVALTVKTTTFIHRSHIQELKKQDKKENVQ